MRTIREAGVREFGPVTWGAYDDATAELAAADMRALQGGESLSDEWIIERLAVDPERIEAMVATRSAQAAAFGRATEIVRSLQTSPSAEGGNDAPGESDDTTSDNEPRREEQDPDAPAEGTETPDATRKGKDYLSDGPDKPAWLLS